MDFVVKKQSSSNRTVRMPDDLLERLSQLAAEKGVSFNQLVIQCCEYALLNLDEKQDGNK